MTSLIANARLAETFQTLTSLPKIGLRRLDFGMATYGRAFFENQPHAVGKSPSVIIPILREHMPLPKSVIDLGCGTGEWLAEFKTLGCRVLGIDGDYVDRSLLRIAPDEFRAADLTKLDLGDARFDLALCLEVAEHLPKSSARPLIVLLCNLSDTILFSAAIPGQRGRHHLNEQWPQYWQKLFRSNEFEMHDVIRPRIWENGQAAAWYRQNIFLCRKGPPCEDVVARLHHELFGQPSIRQCCTLLERAIESRMRRMLGQH